MADGRVLDDRHPGVRDFWVPVLEAWARRGGRGGLVRRRGEPMPARLQAAGWIPLEVRLPTRHPLAWLESHRLCRQAAVSLSPLYLTLWGTPCDVATVFDLTGRRQATSLRARVLWELVMAVASRRAARVVCATQAAAREVERTFPRLGGRTVLVSPVVPPLPRGNPAIPTEMELSRPFVICVASHLPHKRLAPLVRAWVARPRRATLVLVGRGTESFDRDACVRGMGFVSEALRDALLAQAACLISASTAEGFGLPVLAALAAGIPVVASEQAALVEVAGEAARWHSRTDLETLADDAEAVALGDIDVSAQIEAGRLRAAEYTPERAAQNLQKALFPEEP